MCWFFGMTISVLKSNTSFSYARWKDLDFTEEGVGRSYSEEYCYSSTIAEASSCMPFPAAQQQKAVFC